MSKDVQNCGFDAFSHDKPNNFYRQMDIDPRSGRPWWGTQMVMFGGIDTLAQW